MKKIRYLKGKSLLVGSILITNEGINYDQNLENNPKIKELIEKGLLEVFEDTQIKQETVGAKQEDNVKNEQLINTNLNKSEENKDNSFNSELNNSITVSGTVVFSSQPSIPSIPVFEEQKEEVVLPKMESESPIIQDEPQVVVQSKENPVLKEPVPLSEAVESDLKKVKEELEQLTEEIQIPEVPVKKKS